jgi:hypothetical protein
LISQIFTDEVKIMNFIPKLSTGVQRTGNTVGINHNHTVKVAQVPNLNLVQLADDLETKLPLVSNGQFAAFARGLGLDLYGKYCGPRYGDKTGCSPADDQVDATCCRHDVCYDQRDDFDCGCDCNLVRSMPDAIANTSSAEGKAWGAAAMALFSISPCIHHQEICIPGIGCQTVPIPFPGGPAKCLTF